jgi:hypothetical protein
MLINKTKRVGRTFIGLIIFIAGVASTSAFAQTYQKEPLTWGIKAGTVISDFYGDDIEATDSRTGISGGIFFNYRFHNHWALQPEFLFSTKGATLASGLTGEQAATETEYQLQYLDVPVLAKFYIPTSSALSPNLYAGPNVSFKLSGDANERDIDDDLKAVNVGLAFGAGLDFNLGSDPTNLIRTVGLDLRYTLGLTDIFDMPKKPEAQNNVFLAALFLGF